MFVSSVSNTIFIFYLVLQIPCFCLFMLFLSVAGEDSGRYFHTARAVNPVQVENWFLLIDFSRVCFGGLNAAWWRYLISSSFEVMAYVLLSRCLVFSISFYVLWCCSLVMVIAITVSAVICLPSIQLCYYNMHYICFIMLYFAPCAA